MKLDRRLLSSMVFAAVAATGCGDDGDTTPAEPDAMEQLDPTLSAYQRDVMTRLLVPDGGRVDGEEPTLLARDGPHPVRRDRVDIVDRCMT